MIWNLTRSLLFLLDAENAHGLACAAASNLGKVSPFILRRLAGSGPSLGKRYSRSILKQTFLSPLGLAAGFDKNAELVSFLPDLGFGFCEVGTVTPRPQGGNERPRLFRRPEDQSLFNRMGFNNKGATLVAENLIAARKTLPADFRVGINIGKNRATDLEDAARDYAEAIGPFNGLADYVAINVSSPNTPGLRSLQTKESMQKILEAVLGKIQSWSKIPPVLIKLAPELTSEDWQTFISPLETAGVAGWILTNTLQGSYLYKDAALPGGWSGGCLRETARERLQAFRALTQKPIISVGGIMNPKDGAERLALGADLIQIYSGWIYGGPRLPRQILES